MNRILEVCLVAVALATNLTPAAPAQSPALQKGISVQMPPTSNAVPMPEADNEDAWIATVTADSSMYFGTDPVTPAGLADEMKSRPRNREQKLYVKADAHTAFANVERVLEAGRSVFFDATVLLTAQAESPAPGTIVSPKGLDVLVGSSAGSDSIVVQVSNDGRQGATLKVNNRQIASADLHAILMQLLPTRSEKVVVVKADGRLPFADVVHVIDVCHSTGAKVVLANQ